MRKIITAAMMLMAVAIQVNAQDKNPGEKLEEEYKSIPGKTSECSAFDDNLVSLGMINTNSSSPLSFNTDKSLEFFMYSLYSTHIYGDFYWTHGKGLGWKNLTLTNDVAMVKDSNGKMAVSTFPIGSEPKLSRLRIFSYSVPSLITLDMHNGFGFSLGPVFNINLGSCINDKYSVNGSKEKDKYRHMHAHLITADLMADLTMKHVHFWIKYCPMNTMKPNKGWNGFQTLSFGIGI